MERRSFFASALAALGLGGLAARVRATPRRRGILVRKGEHLTLTRHSTFPGLREGERIPIRVEGTLTMDGGDGRWVLCDDLACDGALPVDITVASGGTFKITGNTALKQWQWEGLDVTDFSGWEANG